MPTAAAQPGFSRGEELAESMPDELQNAELASQKARELAPYGW